MLEAIGIISGIVLGSTGTILSIIQHINQKKNDKLQEEKNKLQEKKDRLMFLVQVIIDKNIPRSSRQPFYDEYIALGGNSTVVKFWLEEPKE